ncbi:hypothetical protein AAE02nite_19990 [Adhaeribacter aerolatus]|uniref:histidine kinase n=1 Tax=Adhaeribacter aerolatus TaxID=670289 RepID=A0A512AX84_9BACT|nr:PAS domain S-box protein [Adhaeribacter aerolatus]GEO04335.1 hypothetical protein AAE02nite_19990 [Adhaeribacter aerolatus]
MQDSNGNRILNHVMTYSMDMICTIDVAARFIQVSAGFSQLLDYGREEMEGQFVRNFIHPDDPGKILETPPFINTVKSTTSFEGCYLHKNGQKVTLLWSVVWSEVEALYFCIARDTSCQRAAAEELPQRKELLHLTLAHGADMLALLDENGHYLYVDGTAVENLGYQPEQFIGLNSFQLIHPADLSKVQEIFTSIKRTQAAAKISDFRIKTAGGQYRWVETTISNQLHNPAIRAIFISTRDITERKEAQLKLEQSEQRFRSLFENNPDIVFFLNEAGIILDANPAFLSFANKQKEEVVNYSLYDFLPPEVLPLIKQKHEEAFSGKKVCFDIDINLENLGPKVLSIVKVPLVAGSSVEALHVVIKDITEVTQAHRIIEQHAQRLNTIFESITDAFCTLDKDWNFTYTNSEFDRVLQIKRHEYLSKNIWAVYPEEVQGIFYQQYHQAIATGKSVHFEAYLQKCNICLEVKAYPSEEGLSIYFNDITEKIVARKELEKLSLIANKTFNSTIITDAAGRAEWVNEGFTRNTGYTLSELIGRKPGDLLRGTETDTEELRRIQEKLKAGVPFNSTLLNYKKTGEPFWVSMDISPVFDEAGNITQYIAIHKDITAQKEAEANLVKMSRDLYQQNRDLQQFTYIISHNLRAPVANALGLSKILTGIEKESTEFDTSLNYLQESIFRLDDVLKDINLILSVRDRKDVIEKESLNLAAVCRQALEDLQQPLRQCHGLINLAIPEAHQVQANRAYIYSIFYNLLSNAIKYRAATRTLQIKIQASVNAQGATIIQISDNGSGFDTKKAGDNIFKLYKRFHENREGKGLGLFLVKSHVEAMAGRIAVASQVDVGTTFTIYLNE